MTMAREEKGVRWMGTLFWIIGLGNLANGF